MGRDVLILTEADLRRTVPLDRAAVDATERAFVALAGKGVVMPPVMSMQIEAANGEVDVKAAYLPGFDGFAVKISPGFFDNPAQGLPSLSGMMVLLSAQTGLVEAVFLDRGYLTELRTAAAGAVAARALAPSLVETVCVMGTGAQARLQVMAAHLVRPFARVLVWGRDAERAAGCAADIATALGVEARAEPDAASAVAAAQIVITATPARAPILRAEWLHPGMHVTAMGSDQDGKGELAPEILSRALYIADRVSQAEVMGELRGAMRAGVWTGGRPPELGDVLTGRHPGRTSPAQITVCDLTGTGAQDTAIATHALALARRAGAGLRLDA